MALLELENLSKSFRGLHAVNQVTFSVAPGEIVGLIGPNGAGKSTVFNLITGILKPDAGAIRFDNQDITHLSPHRICQRGIARTFQQVSTFNRLTTLENVTAGRAFGRMPIVNIKQARHEAEEILRLTGLSVKASQPASTLGLVDRRRLEIARALGTKPRLLLLDEMFAGLNTAEVEGGIELVKTIRASGVSLIVVEHVMKVIMGISDRVVVLKVGTKIADCLPHEISSNEHIIEAYLGKRTPCSK